MATGTPPPHRREKTMNAEVSKAAKKLLERAKAAGQCGKRTTAETMSALNHEMGARIPAWYMELLVKFPLGGLEIGWQADEPDDDYDGVAWMEWCLPDGIRSESL